MNYRLLFSTAWKLVRQSKLIWVISLINVSAFGVVSLIPNNLVKYFFYIIIWTLFGIWASYVVYFLALDRNANPREIWRATKSFFFPLSIINAISLLIFLALFIIGFVFYEITYIMIFTVSAKSVPSPNLFIFYLFLVVFAYLTITMPTMFSFLNMVIQQSKIIMSYRQAIKTLIKNFGHWLELAFLFAFLICTYTFILFIIQSGSSINSVIMLNLNNASSYTNLPLYRIMNVLFSFVSVPFFATCIVLSYLNFNEQLPLQSASQ